MKIPARFSRALFLHRPRSSALRRRCNDPARGEREEIDLVFLVGLLHAGGFEVFQDHLLEALPRRIPSLAFGDLIDQFIVFIHAQDAVRRQALDRERPGHAHFLVIFIRFVVQVFVIGLGGDGGIDLFLAGNAQLPPFFMQFFGFW